MEDMDEQQLLTEAEVYLTKNFQDLEDLTDKQKKLVTYAMSGFACKFAALAVKSLFSNKD